MKKLIALALVAVSVSACVPPHGHFNNDGGPRQGDNGGWGRDSGRQDQRGPREMNQRDNRAQDRQRQDNRAQDRQRQDNRADNQCQDNRNDRNSTWRKQQNQQNQRNGENQGWFN